LTLSIVQANGQYFPKGSFGTNEDQFVNEWYSSQLRSLKEPSLLTLSKVPSSETYRFLWLRTFHHPVAIRIDVKLDGTSVLTTKIADGAGGYKPGNLTEDKTAVLTKEETQGFLRRVEQLHFWDIPSRDDSRGSNDGAQWIIEGVKGDHYHLVDRWTPKVGAVRELGMFLAFHLAKIDVPKSQIY
jgi:hypothetical protein